MPSRLPPPPVFDATTERLLRSGEWYFINSGTVNPEYADWYDRAAYRVRSADLRLAGERKAPRSDATVEDDARDGTIAYLFCRGLSGETTAAYMQSLGKYGVGWTKQRVRTYLTRACERWKVPVPKRPKRIKKA
jgi:hypothetical protein